MGDICVPVFCSGDAHCLLHEKYEKNYKKYVTTKLIRFLSNYWIVLILFSVIGLVWGKGYLIPHSINDFLGTFYYIMWLIMVHGMLLHMFF